MLEKKMIFLKYQIDDISNLDVTFGPLSDTSYKQ